MFAIQYRLIWISYLRTSGCSSLNPLMTLVKTWMPIQFHDWFLNRFFNYLEEGSIIIDNESYHSITENSSRKRYHWVGCNREVLFLSYHNIIWTFAKKLELASERAHQVIWLPPYHYQYNPIEFRWSQVTQKVAEKNKTFKISDMERLVQWRTWQLVTGRLGTLCTSHSKTAGRWLWIRTRAWRNFRAYIVISLQDSEIDDGESNDHDDNDNSGEGDDATFH
jgi:hypothetical protein